MDNCTKYLEKVKVKKKKNTSSDNTAFATIKSKCERFSRKQRISLVTERVGTFIGKALSARLHRYIGDMHSNRQTYR